MPYVDFAYYLENYKGNKATEENFYNVALKATKYVDRITFSMADEEDENVKNAICAVIDELCTSDALGYIASESNDGYSISYKNYEKTQNLYQAAKLFLPPELLYRGV